MNRLSLQRIWTDQKDNGAGCWYVTINQHRNVILEVVDSCTYLGSTITSNLSLGAVIKIRIIKVAAIMSKLNRRVWNNNNLTENTKLHLYQASVLSYSREIWTTYARQEKKLNSFHLHCLRRNLDISWQDRVTNTEVLERGHSSSTDISWQDRVTNTEVLERGHSSSTDISWQDRVTNTEVLERAHSSTIYTLLSQRRLRWLGHVHRMADGRIPRYFMYGLTYLSLGRGLLAIHISATKKPATVT